MQDHEYALSGPGRYEFEVGGDCYNAMVVYPTSTCEYTVEVSAGGTFVDHPSMSGTNPYTNSPAVTFSAVSFHRVRINATSNDGIIYITWRAAEFDR